MSLLIERCVCGAERFLEIEAYGLELGVCNFCGTWHQRSGLTADEIEAYYNGGYHQDPGRHEGQVAYEKRYDSDRVAAKARLAKYGQILDWKSDKATSLFALDVGCGNGAFVDELREQDCVAFGIDPDPVAVGDPRDYITRGRLHRSDAPCLNVITYHDVVEHLPDPMAELSIAADNLVSGGFLIVEVPDVFVPAGVKHFKLEHLWYFAGDGLELMGVALGLTKLAHYQPIPGKRTIVWQRN